MPAVIGFWQLPEEEKESFSAIEKEGKIVAYPSVRVENKFLVKPRPLSEIIEINTIQNFQFGLESQGDLHVVEEAEFDGKLLYGVNKMNTPLLSYSRGCLIESRLTLSNLSAYWTILSSDQREIINQNPEFVRWGKRVFQIFRRRTPEWHIYKTYRATRRAKEAFLRGNIELVEY